MTAEEFIDDISGKLINFAEALDLDVQLDAELIDDDTLYFNFHGEDQEVLAHGKMDPLRSLAVLMQSYLDRTADDADFKVKLDVEGRMRAKETELREMALAAAEQLKEPGDSVTLESLNPYDRRLVHMAVSEFGNLETKSLGDGHFKRMVIRLVGEPEPAE